MKRKKVFFIVLGLSVLALGSVYFVKQQKAKQVLYDVYFNDYLTITYLRNEKVRLKSNATDKYVSPELDYVFSEYGSDTLTVFKQNNKRGYLNIKTGKIHIPANKFDRAWMFDVESGLAAVVENQLLGFIDKQGNYIITPQYQYDYEVFNYQDFIFQKNICIIPDASTGKIGMIDENNTILFDCIYDDIQPINNSFYILMDNGKNGLADSAFNIVLDVKYDYIKLSDNGIVVSERRERKQNKQYLLDYDFKTVLSEYVFDYVEKLYGEKKLSSQYYENEYEYFETPYSIFNINGYYGIIDNTTAKVIIEPLWDEITYHSPNTFKVSLDYHEYLIDRNGKYLNK